MGKERKVIRKVFGQSDTGGFLAWKELGETPLETLERVRTERGLAPEIKMTYAGRLDPAAEGELLVLVGEACKQKDQLLGLDKPYQFQVLLGFATDTLDLLGLVTSKSVKSSPTLETPQQNQNQNSHSSLNNNHNNHYGVSRNTIIDKIKVGAEVVNFDSLVNKLTGKHNWPYPAYSSKTYQGKPLWQYARDRQYQSLLENNLVPINGFEVYDISYINNQIIMGEEVLERVAMLCEKVSGDFRQSEILKSWTKALRSDQRYQLLEFEVSVSSGTYVRQIAEKIGQELAVHTTTFSLLRTNIVIDDKVASVE